MQSNLFGRGVAYYKQFSDVVGEATIPLQSYLQI